MQQLIKNWWANKIKVHRLFSDKFISRKRARSVAILWTLLIFFLCFLPSNEIPNVHIPLIDKWAHFILFGVFSFLWLLTFQTVKIKHLVLMLLASVALGWLVEVIQGQLKFLGRNRENMDILADSIGGLLGVIIFYLLFVIRKPKSSEQ